MRKGYGEFDHGNGKTAPFEITIIGDDRYPHAFFLQEADYFQEERITDRDVEKCAKDFAHLYQRQEEPKPTAAMFYAYNSEAKVWDRYFFGVDSDRQMHFEKIDSRAQYELEYQYKVELTHTKSQYVEQSKADLAFVESLNLREAIDAKMKEVFAPENRDRLKTLEQAHQLEQRKLRFDSFQKENADFTYREQNQQHH